MAITYLILDGEMNENYIYCSVLWGIPELF